MSECMTKGTKPLSISILLVIARRVRDAKKKRINRFSRPFEACLMGARSSLRPSKFCESRLCLPPGSLDLNRICSRFEKLVGLGGKVAALKLKGRTTGQTEAPVKGTSLSKDAPEEVSR